LTYEIAREIYDDFTNGTQRISALVGFLNLLILISVWEGRAGFPSLTLFGSTTFTYVLIIYLVGHFEKKVIKKVIEEVKNGKQEIISDRLG
jgi:hypothetical protein